MYFRCISSSACSLVVLGLLISLLQDLNIYYSQGRPRSCIINNISLTFLENFPTFDIRTCWQWCCHRFSRHNINTPEDLNLVYTFPCGSDNYCHTYLTCLPYSVNVSRFYTALPYKLAYRSLSLFGAFCRRGSHINHVTGDI